MIVIDAQNKLVGRFATVAAKKALLGNTVAIINCEKAFLSGSKQDLVAKYKRQRERGEPVHGPFFPRMPDRFVKRAVRGMLPYDKPRGREALTRVKCYLGVPDEVKEQPIDVEGTIDKLPTLKYMSVGAICKELGWKG